MRFRSSGVQLPISEVHQRFTWSENGEIWRQLKGKNLLRETTAQHVRRNIGEGFQLSETVN